METNNASESHAGRLAADVFYSISSKTIVDLASTKDGLVIGAYSGQPEAVLRQEYLDLQRGPSDVALRAIEACYVTPPEEIDRESFISLLEVLPPLNWVHGARSETFMLSEMYYGLVTTICCRWDRRYFRMRNLCTLSHTEIVSLVQPLLTQRPAPQAGNQQA